MSTRIHDTTHPVAALVAGLHCALDGVAATPAWSMTTRDLATAVVDLHREQARLVELELRLVAQAAVDGVGTEVGAADTNAWWANTTRQTRRDVHRRMHLAAAFETRSVVHDAIKTGDLAEDQATMIVRALEALPGDVETDVVQLAEKELVRLAGFHDAADLTRLGKRILDVVAPEVGEAQLAKTLEREEEEAAKACRLVIRDNGHGQCHGRFVLPSADAAMFRKHLQALLAPKHQSATSATSAAGDRAGSASERVETRPSPNVSVRRSVTTSAATPPTGPPTPAESRPRSPSP